MRTPSSSRPAAPRRRRPLPLVAAAVAVLALGAAGCQGAGSSSSAAGPASGSSAASGSKGSAASSGGTGAGAPGTSSGASGSSGSGSSGSSGSSGATASGGTSGGTSHTTGTATGSRCTVTDLRMRLGAGDPGAGNVYYPVRFTNTSGRTCVLDGYPGVSLIRGDGSMIGRPADRMGSRAKAVQIAPGQTVEADLHTVNEGIAAGGCWRKPTFLMVYPPGSTRSMTLATSVPVVCGDTFDVGSVH